MESRIPIVDNTKEPLIGMSTDGIFPVTFCEVVGGGGSCLVYRGKRKEGKLEKTVIIKEYYPLKTNSNAYFYRDYVGAPLKIEGCDKDIQYELNLKKINVERELTTNNRMYATLDGMNNTPYIYAASELDMPEDYKKYSSYIVIDTSEGVTLKKALENQTYNRFGLIDAIKLVKKMLIIAEYMFEKKCIHGDLSLENIYLTGSGDNNQMRFLDFGSAFFIEDYEVDMEDEDAVKTIADKIKSNLAICSSHDDIRCSLTRKLESCKQKYYVNPTKKNATDVVKAINDIDIRCDLYAIVNNFYRLVTGIPYVNLPSLDELAEQYNTDGNNVQGDILIYMLHDMFSKNADLGYTTVGSLLVDIEDIEKVALGMVTPKSLIRKLQMEHIDLDYDNRLIPEMKAI